MPLPLTQVTGRRLAGRPTRRGRAAAVGPVQPARRISWPACGRTRSGACPGWRSCPRSGSARAWPTTWGWARPCSCSRWRRRSEPRPVPARRCWSARCRWSATGSGRPPGSPRSLRVHVHHGARAPARGRARRRGRRRRPGLTTYATAARDVDDAGRIDLAAGRARRGAGDQEQPPPAGQGRAAAAGRGTGSRSPAPRWRTGWPSCGRSWTSLNPGLLGPAGDVPDPLRDADRAARRRGGRRAAARGSPARSCCAG